VLDWIPEAMNGFQVWIRLALLGRPVYCFLPHNLSDEKGEGHMVNRLFTLLFASVLVFPLSTAVFAQEAPHEAKAAKPARWEGMVTRVSKDQSTLTVRDVGSSQEKTVQYDSSTRWVSQEHGSKKVNDIDSSQVKENDRVITEGTWDKDGVLHATLISKRLTKL
jgi:Domain of unknown function (DUF5666)